MYYLIQELSVAPYLVQTYSVDLEIGFESVNSNAALPRIIVRAWDYLVHSS